MNSLLRYRFHSRLPGRPGLLACVSIAYALLIFVIPASAQFVPYTSESLGFRVQVPQGFDVSRTIQRSGSELVNWPDGKRLFVMKQTKSGNLADQFESFMKINLSTLKEARVSDRQTGESHTDAVVNYQGDRTGVFAGRVVESGVILFAFTGLPGKAGGLASSVRDAFRRAEFEIATLSQAQIDYCGLGMDAKDDNKAELLLKKCVELPHTPPEAVLRLGDIQVRAGREADALATYEAGRKQFSRDPKMLAPLARLLLRAKDEKLKDPYRATSLIQLASAASRQQDPAIELILLEALVSSRQCEEALPVAERFAFLQGATPEQETEAARWRAAARDLALCKGK